MTFNIDAQAAGVCTVAGTTVTFTHPGSCVVNATQTGDTRYAPASASQTVAVTKAATGTALTVQPHSLTAAVTPIAPGAGVPTGTVTFTVDGTTVGTAPLTAGTATLPYTVAAGHSRAVSAVYSGDRDFTGSSASTARHDPTITATLSSPVARSGYGWYRAAVTVTFHCVSPDSPLPSGCPASVTLSHSGAGQTVTRTIQAADGGTATVSARSINIDRIIPQVAVTGVRNGVTYPGQAPAARCSARDALSGLARCTLTRHVAVSW